MSLVHEIPRGIRNNNPGNIKSRVLVPWDGEILPSDNGLARFESAHKGLRAMAKTLWHYYSDDGCITYQDGIRRWSATDQQSYVLNVCRWLKTTPNGIVEYKNRTVILNIIKCIIRQENSEQPYTDDEINLAIIDAGYWS